MYMKSYIGVIAGLLGSVSAMAQTPVVNFPMEVSDNAVTETETGKSFTVNGALPAYSVDGARGRCLRFDGYSTVIKDAAIDPTAISKQDITFSLWVAPVMWPLMNVDVDSEDWTTLCGNLDDSKQTGFAFFLSNRGHYTFECWTPQGKVKAVSSTTLPCNKWSHLVGVIHGSASSRADRTIALYNNGQLMASTTMASTFNVGSSKFLIGKSANDIKQDVFLLNAFDGLIDEIQIFNGVQQDVVSDNTPDHAPVLTYDPTVRYADNILRPHFHGCPDGKWSNETHGLTYYNGRWHLFYQCNPGLAGIINQKWGHMSSANLYDWREEPVALYPSEWYDKKGCWSGCLFENAAFNDGKPTILYTGVDFARAMISMASPADDSLSTWTKNAANPIINGVPSGYSSDFRDCYFFENNGDKYIIVGCAKSGIGCAILYKYENGSWTYEGDFFQGTSASLTGTMWEMPNITPMGDGKWLFTVTPLGMGSGVKCIYWIGTIGSNGKFTPQQTDPQDLEMTGTSKEGYGLLSPTIYRKDGKTILLGIVPDKVGGDFNYRWGWAHNYSLPREISLSSDGKTLLQKPYSGLEGMRVTDGAYEGESVAISNSTAALGNVSGRQLELYAEFKITSSNATAKTGFHLLKDGTSYASVYYSANSVTVDLGTLNRVINDNNIFANGLYTGSFYNERMRPGSTVKLHVFLDGSVLDVFVNDHYAFSMRAYPTDTNAVGVEAFSTGSTTFTTLKAWELNPKGQTTGIEGITAPKTAKPSNAIYNLCGQQLSAVPQHGVYIRNGRKYIAR